MREVVLSIVTNERVGANGELVLENVANFQDWVDCDENTVTDSLPDVVKCEILDTSRDIAGIAFKQGDLKISHKQGAHLSINKNGELIIIGKEASHYYINENGELIYKKCNL